MERPQVEQQVFEQMKAARRDYDRLAASMAKDDEIIRNGAGTADGTLAAAQSAARAKELRSSVERYYLALTKLAEVLTENKASDDSPEEP